MVQGRPGCPAPALSRSSATIRAVSAPPVTTLPSPFLLPGITHVAQGRAGTLLERRIALPKHPEVPSPLAFPTAASGPHSNLQGAVPQVPCAWCDSA